MDDRYSGLLYIVLAFVREDTDGVSALLVVGLGDGDGGGAPAGTQGEKSGPDRGVRLQTSDPRTSHDLAATPSQPA
jgi:hypothetical protein